MKNIKLIRICSLVLLLLIVAGGVLFWHFSGFSWRDIWGIASESAALAVFLIIGLYGLKTILWFIPLNALYLGAGFLLDPIPAIALTYAGLVLELTLGFFYGRRLGTHNVRALMEKRKYSKWLMEVAEKNSATSCFLIRILPGPPADVTNMFFGTLNIRYTQFLFSSLLGMTPGMLPVVFIGKAAENPLSKEFLVPFSVSMLFAVCSFGLYSRIVKRQKKRRE
ncbi:MAG: TVP38/TMEM64 family protein [Acetanaerobacterium sp.]